MWTTFVFVIRGVRAGNAVTMDAAGRAHRGVRMSALSATRSVVALRAKHLVMKRTAQAVVVPQTIRLDT